LRWKNWLLFINELVDVMPMNDIEWRRGVVVTGLFVEVTLRRARLVLGWVTSPGLTPGGGTLFRYVTSHPGHLSLSSFWGR